MGYSRSSGLECFASGLAAPIIGAVTYSFLYFLETLEKIIRDLGFELPFNISIVAVLVMTLINIIITFIMALENPKCAIVTIIGMILALFILHGIVFFEKLLLDAIVSVMLTILAILIRVMLSSRSEEDYFDEDYSVF